MTRTLAYSLYQLSQLNNWDFKLWSLYDSTHHLMMHYLPAANFRAFGGNRIKFIFKSVFGSKRPDTIILSHINLAVIGLLIKAINPKCKVWLIAHGIEVWRPQSRLKKLFLKNCDKIICVSNFTRQQMIARHQTDPSVCIVLNNVVDPFMRLPESFTRPAHLVKRHRLEGKRPVLFTLTRLASTEQYKGHDMVIKTIRKLRLKYPEIRYVLAGQYDHKEEIRLQKLITKHKVDEEVIITGFVDESELTDYFLLADLFVLPSKKEGFGIVFIEALACGLPVVCGNADGSVDAIRNGELGLAINPDDEKGLEQAILDSLEKPLTDNKRKYLQDQSLQYFNEKSYMDKLKQLICDE